MRFMVNIGPSGAFFVKTFGFFVEQNGDREACGADWIPVEATSIEQARLIAMRHHGGRKDGLFCPRCGRENHRGACPVGELSLAALKNEIKVAREKFPGNRFLLAALTEELGELAQALLQRKSRSEVAKEAVQVACVAIRILEEGDASFDDITAEESKP